MKYFTFALTIFFILTNFVPIGFALEKNTKTQIIYRGRASKDAVHSPDSFFSKNSNLFNQAGYYNLSAEKNMSMKIGRCFSSEDENTPIAASLLIQNSSGKFDPVQNIYINKVASIWKIGVPQDHYDNLNYEEIATELDLEFHSYNLDKNSVSISTTLDNGRTLDSLKADNNYIYEKLSNAETKTSAVCYYFRSPDIR